MAWKVTFQKISGEAQKNVLDGDFGMFSWNFLKFVEQLFCRKSGMNFGKEKEWFEGYLSHRESLFTSGKVYGNLKI